VDIRRTGRNKGFENVVWDGFKFPSSLKQWVRINIPKGECGENRLKFTKVTGKAAVEKRDTHIAWEKNDERNTDKTKGNNWGILERQREPVGGRVGPGQSAVLGETRWGVRRNSNYQRKMILRIATKRTNCKKTSKVGCEVLLKEHARHFHTRPGPGKGLIFQAIYTIRFGRQEGRGRIRIPSPSWLPTITPRPLSDHGRIGH